MKTTVNRTNMDIDKTTKKINFVKKYPYWVYIILALGIAGFIIAAVMTGLVSNTYWAYNNLYYSNAAIMGKDTLGPNDFWRLILINPEIFQNSFYNPASSNLVPATYELFENWCLENNYSPFLDQEKYDTFLKLFMSNDGNTLNQNALNIYNKNNIYFYITACVLWIVSITALACILFNYWVFIVKQIKANQLPKKERIAIKKAKKEKALFLKIQHEKLKKMKAIKGKNGASSCQV